MNHKLEDSPTSGLISPVSPENKARKPCVLELITSISCRVTVCTTSFLFCSSPSGHWTNLVLAPLVEVIRSKATPRLELTDRYASQSKLEE